MARRPLTMMQGTVDMLILHALQSGAAHGYAVTRWIRERTGGTLALEDAALYQALHRLDRRRVGRVREQPAGAFLQPDRLRAASAQGGSRDVPPVRQRRLQDHRSLVKVT